MTLPTTSNTPDPVAQGLDVQIGTTYFRLVANQQMAPEVRTGASRRQQQAPSTALNPEDFASREGEYVFSQVDFSGGEGLEQFHRRDQEDAERRFFSSLAVVVEDDPGEFAYLRDAHKEYALYTASSTIGPNTGLVNKFVDPLVVHPTTGHWFFPEGSEVKEITDPFEDTPTINTEDPDTGSTNQVLDLAYLDGEIYAATGSGGIFKRNTAGTWASWSAQATEILWAVKGRIVGANDGSLYEFNSAGTATLLTDIGDELWTSLIDAGSAILVGTTGGKIHAYTDNSGTLVAAAITPLNDESVLGMARIGDIIGLLTFPFDYSIASVTRFYTAQVSSGNTLTDLDLIREFAAQSAGDEARIVGAGSKFWILQGQDGTIDEFNVWAYDLAGPGLFHVHNYADTAIRPLSIRESRGRPVWLTNDQVLRRSNGTYSQTSYLISALADHFDAQDKTIVGAKLFCNAVPSGTTAKLYLSTNPDALLDPNHASWTLAVTRTSVDDSEEQVSGLTGRFILVKIEFTRTVSTNTAEVIGFAVRSYQTERGVELVLPIDAGNTIYRPNRMPVKARGRGQEIYDHLQSIANTNTTVTLLVSGEQWTGNVVDVSTVRPVVDERGIEQLACVVRFQGEKVA